MCIDDNNNDNDNNNDDNEAEVNIFKELLFTL